MLTKRNVLGLLRSRRFQQQHGLLPAKRRRIKDPNLLAKLLKWEPLEDEPEPKNPPKK